MDRDFANIGAGIRIRRHMIWLDDLPWRCWPLPRVGRRAVATGLLRVRWSLIPPTAGLSPCTSLARARRARLRVRRGVAVVADRPASARRQEARGFPARAPRVPELRERIRTMRIGRTRASRVETRRENPRA